MTAVPTQAWPYVVARGRLSGYQAIAGPGFLTDAGLTYLWFCLEVPTALVRDDDRTHRFGEVDVRQS